MRNRYLLVSLHFALLNFSALRAQQPYSQFYSRFTLQSGLEITALIQAGDYAVWMAGKNYTSERAFILRCDYTGTLSWYMELDGTSEDDEISDLAPANDGACIFTFLGTSPTGNKLGYGKIDSAGDIVWFKSFSATNLNWSHHLSIIPFGSNFVLAGSRPVTFGSSGILHFYRIDENGNVLASGAYKCIPNRAKKILQDSDGNLLICGDYFHQFSSRAYMAKTDSNFQTFSINYYDNGVEQVHDAMINSANEVLFSGLRWEDQIGSSWSAALMKVNANDGQVIWGKRFVSNDWLVSEFFGIEKATDSASYFVTFEPEYFHGISNPFITFGILRFSENGIADTVYYRGDSAEYFLKLERGIDKSYLQASINTNSSLSIIWKSSNLISDSRMPAEIPCFSGPKYVYPLSDITVPSGIVSFTSDSVVTFLSDSLQREFIPASQDISCNYYWSTDTVTAVEEPPETTEVNVFPNPCSTVFHISSKKSIREIKLTDITGRLVLSKIPDGRRDEINVSDLPSGIYLAHLKFDDNKTAAVKIQVERFSPR